MIKPIKPPTACFWPTPIGYTNQLRITVNSHHFFVFWENAGPKTWENAREMGQNARKSTRGKMKQSKVQANSQKKKKGKKKNRKKTPTRAINRDKSYKCSSCQETLPSSAFSTNQLRKDGFARRCASCIQLEETDLVDRSSDKHTESVLLKIGTDTPKKRKRGDSQMHLQSAARKIRIEKPEKKNTPVLIDMTSSMPHEVIEINSSDDAIEDGEILDGVSAEEGEIVDDVPATDPAPAEHSWVISGCTLRPGDDCEAKFRPNSSRWRPAKVLVPGLKGTELRAEDHICVRFHGFTDSISVPPSQVRPAGSGGARAGMSGRGKEGDAFIGFQPHFCCCSQLKWPCCGLMYCLSPVDDHAGLMSTHDFDETKRRGDLLLIHTQINDLHLNLTISVKTTWCHISTHAQH